jgi:hypothetical protein
MPVLDMMFAGTVKAGKRFDPFLRVPHFQRIRKQAHFDPFAN